MNICSPPPTLYISMDYTLAKQKQLEFVLQAQGTLISHNSPLFCWNVWNVYLPINTFLLLPPSKGLTKHVLQCCDVTELDYSPNLPSLLQKVALWLLKPLNFRYFYMNLRGNFTIDLFCMQNQCSTMVTNDWDLHGSKIISHNGIKQW